MPTIHINVKNRVATANGDSRIINGNSDYSIEFDFDAEWADLNNKIGIFAYNDAAAHKWAYQPVMFSGNTCAVPILRDIHCVYVGVTAGNVRVTTPAKVQCRLSISDYADTEEPPSADIWGQILAKLDELQTEIDEIKAGGVGGTPDWAQNDPNGEGYIKNRCGGYDDVQTKESELLSLNCPADENSAGTPAPPSFFPPSAGDIISVTVDGSTKEYTLTEGTFDGASVLWFGTQNPWSVTDFNALLTSDKWGGSFVPDENNPGALIISVQYGSRSEIAGKTVGLKQRRVSVIPVKINRRYLDVPDWAKADSKPTYTASDVGAVPTDSVTTAVNAESTNENVPTAKAVYDALQNIDIPSGTDISLNVTGATVGQTVKVKTVDADGKPTAWEAVDMAAGDTEVWEKVCQVTTNENVSFIYQPFGGYYKKIRAIFLGETTVGSQVWIYPNTETLPAGLDLAYIFNAPYAAAGKYTIIGEFSSSPYPAPNSSDNWYRGRCSVAREWRPQCLHAGWGDSLFDNYVDNTYAKDIAQGVKSLYWTYSAGEIKAGAQMVVYGVKA